MKKVTFVLKMVGVAAAVAGMTLPAVSHASDVSPCYQVDGFIDVLRLDIKKHSILSRESLRQNPVQTAYSVHGKLAEFDNIFGTDGTVIVGTAPLSAAGIPRGAHMGLHSQSVIGDGFFGGNEYFFPVTWNCTSPETRPDPYTWHCHAKNDAPLYLGTLKLTKVNPSTNPGCTVFQDGTLPLKPLNLSPGQKAMTVGD